jgi:predicted lipoprotein with Yx(FWY)xxD motif
MISLACIALLSACGSDYNDSYEAPEPAPTPAPVVEPTPVDFPVQSAVPTVATANEAGSILVAETGLSLYYFANDEEGISNCNAEDGAPAGASADSESCAGRWPPLLVADGTTVQPPYSSIERNDGTMQWAYYGYPLYQFIEDTSQGDVNGDGAGGVFDLARPTPIIRDDQTYLTARETVLSAVDVAGELDIQRMEKHGFSLYTFDNDAIDTANCFNLGDGGCINAWPPLLADNGAKPRGLYGVAEQENGVMQWTFRGKPLYLFGNDLEAGDTNGQGAGGVWFLANKQPAIQRLINENSWLTATGLAYTLTQDANGELLVQSEDKDQFSLYTFINDEPGVSNCNDACLTRWPAFLATEHDSAFGEFDIIERSDGYMQWTYEGQPLYFFFEDLAIDDTNGHQAGDAFFLVPPAVTTINAESSLLGSTLVLDGIAMTMEVNDAGEFEVVTENKSGRQLYTFDVDAENDSNCDSVGCIGNWPALLVKDADKVQAPYSYFMRDDGYMQWAINGKPLYLFTPDTEAGDQTGEGVGNVWYIARPAPMRLETIDGIGEGFVVHRLDIDASEFNDPTKEGFTLYNFGNDVAGSGVSACTGGCANVWPPLYAKGPEQAKGGYSVIERTNDAGELRYQWAYAGLPLYFFRDDTEAGQANGHELNTFTVATVN